MNLKPPKVVSSPLRRTLYTATAPKFFETAPPVPQRNGVGRGNFKPEFIASATMKGEGVYWGAEEMHNGVVRAWESRREASKQRGRGVQLDVGGYGIPKVGLAEAGPSAVQVGEDAYFVRRNAMGVADGVGGWRKGKQKETPSGSAVFAHRLMSAAAEEAEELEPPRPSDFIGLLDPKWKELEQAIDVLRILESAYAKAMKPPPPSPGSSTALIAVLAPSPSPSPYAFLFDAPSASLKIAHVGDCMAMLIRDATIVFRSTEMWWAFNTPVQLGPSSPLTPTTAHSFSVPVSEGDLVILATDGLSDNLWDEDILDEVAKWDRIDVNVLSQALCSRAKMVAADPTAHTPFAHRARQEGKKFDGGKKDDVSVVVALIAQL